MFIKTNKSKTSSGKTSVSYLLCESYWENGISKTRTILNLSKFPSELRLAVQQYFSKSSTPKVSLDNISVESSIDYGYFFVLLEIVKNLRIDEVIEKIYPENSNLVILMILGKIITRGSKLAIVNWIKRYPVIAEKLNINLSKLNEKILYAVLDDLDSIQDKIEHKWNIYHGRKADSIYLYDITSFYFEGTENELATYGYDRDKKKGKKIITAGLITNSEGMPLKVKIFEGNMQDCQTVKQQIIELKEEFNTKEIIFVGDRGMRIRYNLENMKDYQKEGVKYITGLTTDEIRELVKNEIIQLSLFQKELVEIEDKDKRYILCHNPKLAEEKRRSREQKKEKFELEMLAIQRVYENKQFQITENKEKVKNDKNKKLKLSLTEKEIDSWKYRIRKAQEKYGMQKVYTVTVTEEEFKIEYDLMYYRKLEEYDGKYVFETTVSKGKLNKKQVRETYKKLQSIEHAFRVQKSELEMRPIFHRRAKQTRGHILIGMFAYSVVHELEKRIYPWLKEQSKLSFRDIQEELKDIKLCTLLFGKGIHKQAKITKLNDNQKKILELLGIKESILFS